MARHEGFLLIIKLVFAAGTVLTLLWFVVKPMISLLRMRSSLEELMPTIPDISDEDELQIPTGLEAGAKPSRKQMLEEIRADPRRTATLLSQWLRERKE